MGLGGAVIDVGAQRVQRHAALAIPLGTRDLGTVQAARDHDLDALGAQPQRVLHRALHRAAEHDALLKLLGDIFGYQLGVKLRLAYFLDRQLHRPAGHARQFLAQAFDVLALLADDDARTRRVHRDRNVLRRTLDHNQAHGRALELVLDEFAQPQVRNQMLGIVAGAGIPARGPVAVDAETESDWIDFLAHQFFPLAMRRDFFSSLTVTEIWLVRLRMRTPRPLARA